MRATEAFTAELPGLRRAVAPVYSLMIATEPLPGRVLGRGRARRPRPTFADFRHMIIYGQRTADGRFAFGGRGAPYHFGSRDPVRSSTSTARCSRRCTRRLRRRCSRARRRRDHPPLGRRGRRAARLVPVGRASTARTGIAWAGGYVGDGVSTTNLAGRTIADLVTGATRRSCSLPWVGHDSPDWEPEPLRWLGHRALTGLARSSDRVEARTGRPARRIELLNRLLGG